MWHLKVFVARLARIATWEIRTFYRSSNTNHISTLKQLLLDKSVIRLQAVAGDIEAQAGNWIRVLKHLTHCSYIRYLALRDIKRSR